MLALYDDHAAVCVLLMPEQLAERASIDGGRADTRRAAVVARRRPRLGAQRAQGDEGNRLRRRADPRVTREGFTKSSWAEATGTAPSTPEEAQADD
ncbi:MULTISPECIES: hypothetical protein [Sandaracinus]|uniref:hypothetical protein n=1 Tax=Sandaracinus TaxID=1055688 RepID=UPI0019D46E4B|nr:MULTISPECIES: hypothetical protein [Sandaracinus]UJR87272.1 Hypothetical protein I5071_640 [Sandaracinus amylolyticus]